MELRIRKITVEEWPSAIIDRLRLALWIALIRWRYCDRTTAWLLVCIAALIGLLLITQALRAT